MAWWTVPEMWPNSEVWIIGGGPSMPQQFGVPQTLIDEIATGKKPMAAMALYLESIHHRHVIAINSAFKLGNWVDMLFFGDTGWYNHRKEAIAHFYKLKVTCAHTPKTNDFYRRKIKFLRRHENKYGISPDPTAVCWNKNSGAAAISVAANAGARRIVLLGFDMHSYTTNQAHWHYDYRGKKLQQKTHQSHLKGFGQIAADAEARGIELLNASPNSAITELRKVNVEDIL